jgi:hypothetical protein
MRVGSRDGVRERLMAALGSSRVAVTTVKGFRCLEIWRRANTESTMI